MTWNDTRSAPMTECVDTPGVYPELAARIARHVDRDGFIQTPLPGLTLMAYRGSRLRRPEVYDPSLVFVLQGEKTAFLEDRVVHYGAGHYLVQAMPVPFECESRADAEAPLLGLVLRVEPAILNELVTALPEDAWPDAEPTDAETLPMAAVAMDARMADALERLLGCLDDALSARAMYDTHRREVIFEALRGPQGHLLRHLIHERGAYGRIAEAINRLHAEYAEPLAVQELAEAVHMSPSSFHHHFKQVTRLSPLQYQKRIRLLAARDLLASRVENVGGAAHAVGYQSISQFSREYKRYFGVAPTHDRTGQASAGSLETLPEDHHAMD